jgi:dihydrofolate synthase/folylpolyglutamate synthase
MSAEDVESSRDGTDFTYQCGERRGPLHLRTPLHGAHQATNAALAVAATDAFTGGTLDDGHIQSGVGAVWWPGRFQVERSEDGTWVYDIAHNPAAARVLAETVEQFGLPAPIVLVASVLGDKDWTAVLAPLLEVVDAAVFTVAPSAPSERRWDPSAAREALDRSAAIEVVPDFDGALASARARAGAGTVLVTGSCHTVGDALRRNGNA